MKNEDEKQPSKGILQTGAKPNTSKTRRISWGEVKIKEFAKHDEVNNKSGDEYNIALSQFVIKEEKKESESFVMDESRSEENINVKDDFKGTISNFAQNKEAININAKILEEAKIDKNYKNDKVFNYFGLNMNIDSSRVNNPKEQINNLKNQNQNVKVTSNPNYIVGISADITPDALNLSKDSLFVNNIQASFNVNNGNFNNINNNSVKTVIENPSAFIKSIQTTMNDAKSSYNVSNGTNNLLTYNSQSQSFKLQENINAANPFNPKVNDILSNRNYFNNMNEDSDSASEPINNNRITLQGITDVFDMNNKIYNISNKTLNTKNEVTKLNNNTVPIPTSNMNLNANSTTFNAVSNMQPNSIKQLQVESSNNNTTNSVATEANQDNNLNNLISKTDNIPNKNQNNKTTINNIPTNINNIINPITNFTKLTRKNFESDEKSLSVENKPIFTNRMTLNLKDQLENKLLANRESTDSELEEKLHTQNKRYTINLKDTLKLLYDDNDDDDLNNSLEQRIENRRESNISASPINIKNQKLYYETCLSSASRCIETTEAKQIKHENLESIKETKKQLQFDNNSNTETNPINNNITNLNIVMNESSQEETPKFENENELANKTKQRITITEIFHDSNKKSNEVLQKSPVQIKNPTIPMNTQNLVPFSPVNSNFGMLRINQDNNDVDKRLNDLIYVLSESNKSKQKNIIELDKLVNELIAKLNEFNEEHNKIKIKKQQIKESIEKLDNESHSILENKMSSAFPLKCFGIKVLSSDFNLFKIQLLNRINLIFEFKEFNKNFLKTYSKSELSILKLEKVKFDIIKLNSNLSDKTIDDSAWYKLIRSIYEDLLGKIFQINSDYSVANFKEKLKILLKNSGSFLYFLEIFSTICTVGLEINLRYIKENMSAIAQFSMFNRLGFKVVFLFEFEICNSFYGINYRDSNIVNISLSESNFVKSRTKVVTFVEEIKKFLNYKDKLKNPLFFKEFLFRLNENILNL